MSKTVRRLLLSFALSIACAGAVHWWFINGDSLVVDYGDQKPIARITEFTNEVHRRPLRRLIWQTLSQNDSLFGGEQVRTPANATAILEIIETGTVIELDPGSLITLERNDGKLSLDFLQGNLFVKGGSGAGDGLSLKTDGKELQVGQAELSLGKAADGKVDVQVLKGSVEGAVGVQDPFQIVMPLPFAEVFVFPDLRKSIKWEWKNNFESKYSVRLEMGPTRDDLKPVADVKVEQQKILGSANPGDYFWRLVASDPKNPADVVTSKVYKIKIQPIRAPLPMEPQNSAQLAVLDTAPEVELKWVNPGKLKGLTLEIAESKDLKKGYQKVSVEEKEMHSLTVTKKGEFFWRLTGFLPKTNEAVSSEVFRFTTSLEKGIRGPELVAPLDKGRVQGDIKKLPSVEFKWSPVPSAKQYHLVIDGPEKGKTRDLVTADPKFQLSQIPPGEYTWRVYAIVDGGKRSPDSEIRTLNVSNLPQIAWKNPEEKSLFFYYSANPEIYTEWSPPSVNLEGYRFYYRKAGEPEEKNQTQATSGSSVKVPLSEEGEWIVQVEALVGGQPVARSLEKTFDVKVAPLLPAPSFVDTLPNPMKADRKGAVSVQWKAVPDAVGYRVDLVDGQGAVVKTLTTDKAEIAMQKLKPGKLGVRVQAVDQAQRRGVASESRELIVPDTSDVRAPKVMKIEVK